MQSPTRCFEHRDGIFSHTHLPPHRGVTGVTQRCPSASSRRLLIEEDLAVAVSWRTFHATRLGKNRPLFGAFFGMKNNVDEWTPPNNIYVHWRQWPVFWGVMFWVPEHVILDVSADPPIRSVDIPSTAPHRPGSSNKLCSKTWRGPLTWYFSHFGGLEEFPTKVMPLSYVSWLSN